VENSRRSLCILFAFLTVATLFFGSGAKPAEAVPSYARQTGLRCSGCHYTPPELNPAGRRWQQRRGRRARGRRSRPRVSRPDRGKCLLSHGATSSAIISEYSPRRML